MALQSLLEEGGKREGPETPVTFPTAKRESLSCTSFEAFRVLIVVKHWIA